MGSKRLNSLLVLVLCCAPVACSTPFLQEPAMRRCGSIAATSPPASPRPGGAMPPSGRDGMKMEVAPTAGQPVRHQDRVEDPQFTECVKSHAIGGSSRPRRAASRRCYTLPEFSVGLEVAATARRGDAQGRRSACSLFGKKRRAADQKRLSCLKAVDRWRPGAANRDKSGDKQESGQNRLRSGARSAAPGGGAALGSVRLLTGAGAFGV